MTRAIRWVLVVLPVWVLAMSCRDSAGDRRVELRQAAVVATSSPIGKARSLGTGFGLHACALDAVGNVRCWGSGTSGQLGDGLMTDSSTPVVVSGLSGVVSISAGPYTTCAVRGDGTVTCWGLFFAGPTPVDINGIGDAI